MSPEGLAFAEDSFQFARASFAPGKETKKRYAFWSEANRMAASHFPCAIAAMLILLASAQASGYDPHNPSRVHVPIDCTRTTGCLECIGDEDPIDCIEECLPANDSFIVPRVIA